MKTTAGIILILITVLFLYNINKNNTADIQLTIENTQINKQSNENITDIFVKQDEIFLKNLEEKHPIKNIEQETSTTIRLTKSFKRMFSMGNYFNAQNLQRKEIQELLNNPENLKHAKNILLDIQSTNQDFGEDQALARIYAIKMLTEQARLGDTQPLYEVTANLAKQLNQQIEQSKKITQGREYDLENLIFNIVKLSDINELEDSNNVAALLVNTGFNNDMSEEIVRYYDDALFFPLLKKYGRVKASAILAENIITKTPI